MVGTRCPFVYVVSLIALFGLAPAWSPAEETAVSNGITFFSKSEIDQVRAKAIQDRQMPADAPDGWSRSNVDPVNVLAAFSPLWLKKAYVLVGYRLVLGADGEGGVYAVPEKQVVRGHEYLWERPRPSEALDDVMDAIAGDCSPWSYVCASILQRELGEFGAMWHGQNWSTHMVLDRDPWQPGHEPLEDEFSHMPFSESERWDWAVPRPKDWRPRVRVDIDTVEVTFYTHSTLGRQAIYRHTDVFKPTSYRLRTKSTVVAQGPGRMLF